MHKMLSTLASSLLILTCSLSAQSVPAPLLSLPFNFPNAFDTIGAAPAGTNYIMRVGSGSTALDSAPQRDLHSPDQQGVSGQLGDRAFDNSGCNAMGSLAAGDVGKLVLTGTSVMNGLRSFTLTGWIKPESVLAGHAIIVTRYSGTTNSGIELRADPAVAGSLLLRVGNDTTTVTATSDAVFNETGTWVFFAVSFDGTAASNNVKFYRGSSASAVSSAGLRTIALPHSGSPARALTVGAGVDNNWTHAFDGALDALRIFGSTQTATPDGVLSESQINQVRLADTAAPYFTVQPPPTYWVDQKNGNDANNGSEAAPWKTIYFAETQQPAKLGPGVTLVLKTGNYPEKIRGVSGNATQGYITYRAAPGAQVTLDGANQTNSAGFEGTSGESWVRIQGIRFTNWVNGGIRFAGGNNVIVEDCALYGNGFFNTTSPDMDRRDGAKFANMTLVKVRNCTFHVNSKNGLAIELSTNVYVEGCRSFNNRGVTRGYLDESDGFSTNNSQYIRFANCVAWGNGEDGFDAGVYDFVGTTNGLTSDIHYYNCRSFEHPGKGFTTAGHTNSNYTTRDIYWLRCQSVKNDPWNTANKEAAGFAAYQAVSQVRMIHCVSAMNHRGFMILDTANNFYVRNSIFADNTSTMDQIIFQGRDEVTKLPITFPVPTWDSDYCLWRGGAPLTVVTPGPHDLLGAVSAGPLFRNTGIDDFSPMLVNENVALDTGGPITLATNSAQATNPKRLLAVQSVRYFTAGWGVGPGDLIRVGDATARIISVDSTNHTVLLDRSISWDANDPVTFDYTGNAPDLGAIELF